MCGARHWKPRPKCLSTSYSLTEQTQLSCWSSSGFGGRVERVITKRKVLWNFCLRSTVFEISSIYWQPMDEARVPRPFASMRRCHWLPVILLDTSPTLRRRETWVRTFLFKKLRSNCQAHYLNDIYVNSSEIQSILLRIWFGFNPVDNFVHTQLRRRFNSLETFMPLSFSLSLSRLRLEKSELYT